MTEQLVGISVVACNVWIRLRRSFGFFFSSRRRHTRFDCDWSSDVCSSDLSPVGADGDVLREPERAVDAVRLARSGVVRRERAIGRHYADGAALEDVALEPQQDRKSVV